MFFNVSDDLAMKNDPNSTYIYTSVFPEDSHLAAWLVVLWPPMAKVTIDKVKNVF